MALNEILAPARITQAAPAIEDIRDNAGEFLALSRVPFVPAENGDILARVSARVTAGDLYPDGSPAVVRSEPPMQLVPIAVTNFKRATALTATDLDLVSRIINGDRNPGLFRTLGEYIGERVRKNRMGNYMRMEQAVWGMMLDSFSFDGNGYKTGTITWGKPSALKVTPGTPWSTAASAAPVTDISDLIQTAADQYGVRYDRATMSTQAFNYMVGTAQFQAQASVYSAVTFGTNNVGFPPASNTGVMLALAGRILGIDIEIFDGTMPVEANAGTVSSTRYLPANKVVLSRKSDDGNRATWDFANGTVLEAINAAIAGASGGSNLVGGFPGDMIRGPVSFAVTDRHFTSTEIHDVLRGFPRCHNTAATAVLTVSA